MSNCPKCNKDTIITVYGHMWDWDIEMCGSRDCDYEIELDISTCFEPDGSTYIIHKEYDDEDENLQDL